MNNQKNRIDSTTENKFNHNLIKFKDKYFPILMTFNITICLIPIVFFDEEYIKNSVLILSIITYYSDLLPNIQNLSQLGKETNISLLIKFQLTFMLVPFLINILYNIYKYLRLYLCSLEYIKYDEDYFSGGLNQDKVNNSSLENAFLIIFLVLLTLDFFLFGIVISYDFQESIFFLKIIFSSEVGVAIFIYYILDFASLCVYSIIEVIAHLRLRRQTLK